MPDIHRSHHLEIPGLLPHSQARSSITFSIWKAWLDMQWHLSRRGSWVRGLRLPSAGSLTLGPLAPGFMLMLSCTNSWVHGAVQLDEPCAEGSQRGKGTNQKSQLGHTKTLAQIYVSAHTSVNTYKPRPRHKWNVPCSNADKCEVLCGTPGLGAMVIWN